MTGDVWPEGGEGVIITFPNSKSVSLRSHVLERIAEPRPHLLLAAPLLDGEVTLAAKGEAILMHWQSKKATHSLAGTVDGFVDSGIAAWRVSIGEADGAKAADDAVEISATAPGEEINRRRHVRVPIRRRAEVVAAGKRLNVETIDISEGGIRCRWRGDAFWAPSRGSSLIVSLAVGPGRPIALSGSVVRVRPVPEGVELSVAFTHDNDSAQTVQSLRRYVVALERRQLLQEQDSS